MDDDTTDTNNNNNNDREESKIITAYQRTTPLKFLVQSLIAVIIIVFSVTQITVNPDHDNNIWVGLICTILGLFFPHPTPQVADVITGGGGTASDDNATTAPDTGGAVIKSTTHTRSRPSPRVHAHRLSQRLNKNDHKSKKDNNIVTD